MKRLIILAAFVTAAAGGRLVHAQTPAHGNAAANPEPTAALQMLRPGHLVRISASGVRDTGRVALASSDQLTLRRRRGQEVVPASSIDSLWTWKSNAGNGAITGAIAVGALGVFMGHSVGGGAAAAVGTVGGLVGALFGGVIGSVLSHWTLVHPLRP